MKKINVQIFATLFAVFFCLVIFPATAFAGVDEEIPIIPEETETPKADSVPLTPDGNLTLVDDISEEQSEDKQFVTLVSKNGNYFYLVIDRAGDKENVYFLNLVDESDLLALVEETDTVPQTPAVTPQPEPVPEQTPEPEPQEEKNNSTGATLLILLIVCIAGGGFYYFNVKKNKGNTKGNTMLEEYDFEDDEDEDEYEVEYENEGEEENEADNL
mgnify:CR=1 FL=1|jgi:hypothetical protein